MLHGGVRVSGLGLRGVNLMLLASHTITYEFLGSMLIITLIAMCVLVGYCESDVHGKP